MVYVPKDAVVDFMKRIEHESNKRINRYRDYATGLKAQFGSYEAESEKYYSELLDKFKKQAREVV